MAQQTWTQAFFYMVRFFVWGIATLLIGTGLPVKLWVITGNPWLMTLLVVLVPLAAWVFQPRHLQGLARGVSFFLFGGPYVDPNRNTP